MSTPRHYQHLTPEDRPTIMTASRQNYSVRAIARTQGRSDSTISRGNPPIFGSSQK
ncbi:MAG: helix-turn-helix domain-containing protein [Lautropia sp.]|nr:helix-turn-helix domain-containing protein [Lautropia sp.]